MSEEQLKTILEEGDDQQCMAFFKGMPEKRRRALAPTCIKWFRKINSSSFIETKPGTFSRNPRMPVAATAVFAVASLSELKKLGWHARPDGDLAYEMLLDRRPQWLADWVTHLLEEEYFWNHWSTIRRLMAEGLIDKPDHPNYILAMISGVTGPGGRFKEERTVEQALRDDPSLLKEEVWRLFECEGAGQNSLANWDRFSRGGKWCDAFVALVESGDLSRDRLLDCSLDALDLDFNHYRAKWFATFHDTLQPTAEEQREFAERYLRLLGVSAPNIVSWAFKKVESLSKTDALEPRALIAGLGPVLESRQKGIVKKALKLLVRAAKQSPDAAPDAALAALSALAHEEPDVQSAALDVVEGFGDPDDEDLVARLEEYAAIVAPSERKRLGKWLSTSDEQATAVQAVGDDLHFDLKQLDGLDSKLLHLYRVNVLVDNLNTGQLDIPAATFDGMDIPRLHKDQQVTPIEDLDELIEVCSRLIEDDSDADDVERALDGVSRLCDQRPDDFEQRVGPLLKRVTHRLKKDMAPFIGLGADDDICGLVYAWCTGIVLEGRETSRNGHWSSQFEIEGEVHGYFSENLRKAIGFLSRRVLSISRRAAAGKAAQLLSAPTHKGGWIDPLKCVERVNARFDNDPDVMDVSLAMLRLAPDGRCDALSRLNKPSAEWGRAVRYALGGKGITIGRTPALWIAAARCRSPWTDDVRVAKAFPDHGPDAGRAASYKVEFPTRAHGHTDVIVTSEPSPPTTPDSGCVTVTFHAQRGVGEGLRWELGGVGGKSIGSIRWTASIWPQSRESFFAGAACDIADNLDWWEAQWQNKTLLEPLLDSGTPLKEMGLLLLCVGLAAKDPGEYGLATDIAIRAIEDGRLGTDNFGLMLGRLLPTGLIKPARWQQRLTDVSRISPVHATIVQQSLQQCFSGITDDLPRDLAKLLDLLHELSIDLGQGISHELCREFLAGIKGSGRAAKMAKALLNLETDDPSRAGALVREALEQRLASLRRTAKY